jgi:hypothetical protein
MKKVALFFLLWLHVYVGLGIRDRRIDHIDTCCGDNPSWVEVDSVPLGLAEYASLTGVVAVDGLVALVYRLRRRASSKESLSG